MNKLVTTIGIVAAVFVATLPLANASVYNGAVFVPQSTMNNLYNSQWHWVDTKPNGQPDQTWHLNCASSCPSFGTDTLIRSNGDTSTCFRDNYGNRVCGWCAAFTQALSGAGATSNWYAGTRAMMGTLQVGSVIATFDSNTRYPQSGSKMHTAILSGYNYDGRGNIYGIYVIDSNWRVGTDGQGIIAYHYIPYNGASATSLNVLDAGAYSQVMVPQYQYA